MSKEDLKNTFIEEYTSAKILEGMNKQKSSIILLSKSLFAICDYLIFVKYGKLPKNHSERFRILETKEEKIYNLVDSVWSRYRDTYSKPSNKESINELKRAIRELVNNESVEKEIKKTVEESRDN